MLNKIIQLSYKSGIFKVIETKPCESNLGGVYVKVIMLANEDGSKPRTVNCKTWFHQNLTSIVTNEWMTEWLAEQEKNYNAQRQNMLCIKRQTIDN